MLHRPSVLGVVQSALGVVRSLFRCCIVFLGVVQIFLGAA